jgi:hypothetical protein
MGIDSIKVVGGQMIFDKLNTSVNEEDQAIMKAYLWLDFLKDKKIPVKWLKTTKKGTKVNFELPTSQEQWDNSLAGLKEYIEEINEKYNLDLTIS